MNNPRPGEGEHAHHAGDERGPPPAREEGGVGPTDELVVYSAEALRAVDRLANEQYGLATIVLMENAGHALADAVVDHLGGAGHARVVIACGPGNNGGDGFVAARHLANRGAQVRVIMTHPQPRTAEAAVNLKVNTAMSLPTLDASARPVATAELAVKELGGLDAVIDCLLGTGISRSPQGAVRELIGWINEVHRLGVAVIAADVPSGMDADTGAALGPAVNADLTVTFAGLKQGFLTLDAQALIGEVIVADIGVPRRLLDALGQRLQRPPHFDWPASGAPPPAPRASHPGAGD